MNPAEYDIMAAAEHDHWWYQGLRNLIARAWRRFQQSPAADKPAVLDAGCGTGENLRFLSDLLSPAYLGGFDISPLALQHAVRKCPGADLYLGDICRPELHVSELDLILACDVIYTTGAEAASPGLRALASALRPAGMLFINVPAFDWLRSRHDLAIHTRQRFTVGQVRRLIESIGLVPEILTYRVWAPFPAILAKRLSSLLRPKCDPESARSDVYMPSRAVNTALRSMLSLENVAIENGVRFPWGSSVFVVARKPSQA